MDVGLTHRVAVVTGAAGGIGRATAAALAREGARVALIDRDRTRLQQVADDVVRGGGQALVLPADLTDESQVVAAVAAAGQRWGALDVVVACAGISGPVGAPLEAVTLQQWNDVFAVNVTGVYLVVKHALPLLRVGTEPSVVVVASDSAVVAAPGMVPYCASKGALVQLARALAVETAGEGIRVNALCPSVVDTPMSRADLNLPDGFEASGYPVQFPDEVADHIVFLASPRARSINATTLLSDFGSAARSGFPA